MSQSKAADCPQAILDLVARFDEHREAYQQQTYNEAQVRREFIDPFFTALGWDIDNRAGLAEAYKDVIHEDAIKVGGATKAPDYCFRIGGTRKFFVEAKKPAVGVESDPGPAYQVRRYAWSNKLPLSIVTDFEEFAVYDCRIRPKATDRASVARVFYCTHDQYVDKWPEIAAIFSKDAILKGSFDKYAESNRRKKGTAEVDDEILKEIESWREALAKNFAMRNERLSARDLNFAVERTIDRIIFLRMCEDRGIEPYGRLQGLLNGTAVYARLAQLFREADDKYNAGLFYFRQEADRGPPDELTLSLALDDRVLKEIIVRLYYPESPYEFSVLPTEILGQVYEQFLGKVIRLTAGHRAVVEEKPEVRKAGGVYYTPTYIVEYIVKNTVGKLLEGKSPAEAGPERETKSGKRRKLAKGARMLRVLDPACGSGSFLLGAYQYLLDWHRDWYVADGPGSHKERVYQGAGGQWRLSIREKKRILLNNVYGVDIDAQAVEVTKLSLLLKVLEGETAETIGSTLRLFHERALPDLNENVKCGNSLIGPDFYENQQLAMFDEEERYRINVFDWKAEFAEAMEAGGFDAVIGNPPYIRMETFKPLKNYLQRNYACHDERSDIYAYFIERGHRILKSEGRFGMIVSNKFVRANYGKPLRRFMADFAHVETIADFAGLPVFPGATVRTLLCISRRGPKGERTVYCPPPSAEGFAAIRGGVLSVSENVRRGCYPIAQLGDSEGEWNLASSQVSDVLVRLECNKNNTKLGEYCEGRICRGIVSGLTRAFVIDRSIYKQILRKNPNAREIIKPFLNGRDIRRYHVESPGLYLIYTYHGVDIRQYAAVEKHLRPFKSELDSRATEQEWYELQQPQLRFAEWMKEPKLVFPDIATRPRFAVDEDGHFGSNTTYFIPGQDLFLLGILNSRVSFFFFKQKCAGLESKNETYLRFFGQYLEGFPVPETSKSSRSKLVSLVDSMRALQISLSAAKTDHQKTALQRQIDATDRRIDQLVYQLYGLSDDEIRIVEEATQ